MELNDLWQEMPPKAENVEIIKRDLQNGIAPNLPYFIIGSDDVKTRLGRQMEMMDQNFQFSLLKGQYGNGKTNLLKYLEYYTDMHPECSIKTEVWRADVDKSDVVKFILYILQQKYSSKIIEALRQLPSEDLHRCCNNYEGSFAPISDYVQYLDSIKGNDENVKYAIQLGTGQLYTKRDFEKVNMLPLTDYNRHEVLVFFLNILAKKGDFVLICIDELEKLQERSKVRFQNFLTSLRELIDLSSFIKGHMLIVAMTDTAGKTGIPLESYNPALERRISQYTYALECVREDEIFSLVQSLSGLLGKVDGSHVEQVVSKLRKLKAKHTNELVVAAYKWLSEPDARSWNSYIEDANIRGALNRKCEELKEDDIELNIHSKFFAPMETYCEMISQGLNDYTIKSQQYQCVRDNIQGRSFVFLFNGDTEANINRVKNVYNLYSQGDIVVFKPKELDLSHEDFASLEGTRINIVQYDPVEMIALLEMYQEDYQNENLRKAIELYTQNL